MGSALWNSLRASDKQPPTNIVNADVIVVEDVLDGHTKTTVVKTDTTPPPGPRPKFKPVGDTLDTPKAISDAPPSGNLDLVGDDAGVSPEKRSAGRPRLHASNAVKQKAYRDRVKTSA